MRIRAEEEEKVQARPTQLSSCAPGAGNKGSYLCAPAAAEAASAGGPGTGRTRCTCRPAPPTVPPCVRGRPDSSREMRGKEEVFMGRCSEAKEGRHPGHLQSQRASSGRVGAWQRTPGGLLGGRWGYTDDSHQAPGPCFFLTFFFCFYFGSREGRGRGLWLAWAATSEVASEPKAEGIEDRSLTNFSTHRPLSAGAPWISTCGQGSHLALGG